jgi:hypothetical protein
MRRQSVITQKKRGPPATGKGELVGVRIQPRLMQVLNGWIADQEPGFSRPEAIRRLVERALIAEPSAPRARSKGAPKAAEMASHEINKLGDKSATDEERATRKRRLISGPKEFRGIRRK